MKPLDLNWDIPGRFVAGAAARAGRFASSAPWRAGPARWISLGAIVSGVIAFEAHTSLIQASVFTWMATHLSYRVEPGADGEIVYPRPGGPLGQRTGYARLPEFERRLSRRGFRLVERSSFSPALAGLARTGITPPYREPDPRGLLIAGLRNDTLYDDISRGHYIRNYDDIPPLVTQSLLHLEDRDLSRANVRIANPSVDWPRFGKAAFLYAAHKAGMPVRVEGGSTLAVQMEKYMYANGGLTTSPFDKLRQILSASLKVYRQGPDTRARRPEIVLDYLNSMPLAATPGRGEVQGLGEGLHAWFGLEPDRVFATLGQRGETDEKATAYKHVLALLYAVRAPSRYLARDRDALESRIAVATHTLTNAGVIHPTFARRVRASPLRFLTAPSEVPALSLDRRGPTLVRGELQRLLGTRDLYELDRLDLQVESTLDQRLQEEVSRTFRSLQSQAYVESHGLVGERLLGDGDPSRVFYSLLLAERTSAGNLLRVSADNLDQPFDFNAAAKIELGSTAKLRTLLHYLEIVDELRRESRGRIGDEPTPDGDRDPISAWAAALLMEDPSISAEAFLDSALERRYSADPSEPFFTGGGIHVFENFDPDDDTRRLTVREATMSSTNLVYIRLMRDLVRHHQQRLPFDVDEILTNTASPARARLLEEVMDQESRLVLARAHRELRGLAPNEIVEHVLGARAGSPRDLALLFYAWNPSASRDDLMGWLLPRTSEVSSMLAAALTEATCDSSWTLSDYGFLLGIDPVELWCARRMCRDSEIGFEQLLEESSECRRASMAWLADPRRVRVQNQRLRTRIERDAFERMAPYWQRLGFPFERLVPSLATAIGSSADRPAALATLMGILLSDGVRRSDRVVERLAFGAGTPYHTVFAPAPAEEEHVISSAVARAARSVLVDVVERGTARRVSGAFHSPAGEVLVVGGKTGSGDNRFQTFRRDGRVLSSRAINRTAVFAFFLGDRHYGVMTATVMGPEADRYSFTSALPLAVLRLLAPAIERHLAGAVEGPPPAGSPVSLAVHPTAR